ncbi:MAG: hypothetical protein A3J24_03665 [Deltaproteobacteria bacterium RIFCSPLOWO2_02_FULL_53_8]|nr:MAG: hypothetical protein A3J24_03665 [Deltaproteobacteria bacterium RIFCSPLOWO2_02_FULL_53_8]
MAHTAPKALKTNVAHTTNDGAHGAKDKRWRTRRDRLKLPLCFADGAQTLKTGLTKKAHPDIIRMRFYQIKSYWSYCN